MIIFEEDELQRLDEGFRELLTGLGTNIVRLFSTKGAEQFQTAVDRWYEGYWKAKYAMTKVAIGHPSVDALGVLGKLFQPVRRALAKVVLSPEARENIDKVYKNAQTIEKQRDALAAGYWKWRSEGVSKNVQRANLLAFWSFVAKKDRDLADRLPVLIGESEKSSRLGDIVSSGFDGGDVDRLLVVATPKTVIRSLYADVRDLLHDWTGEFQRNKEKTPGEAKDKALLKARDDKALAAARQQQQFNQQMQPGGQVPEPSAVSESYRDIVAGIVRP